MEIKVVVKGVRFVGTATAWRHPFGRQAAIPERHGVLIHKKCCFSYFRGTGNAQCWVCTARRQATDSGR